MPVIWYTLSILFCVWNRKHSTEFEARMHSKLSNSHEIDDLAILCWKHLLCVAITILLTCNFFEVINLSSARVNLRYPLSNSPDK